VPRAAGRVDCRRLRDRRLAGVATPDRRRSHIDEMVSILGDAIKRVA